VVAAPVYSWTGFYVGGNGGYSWKDSSVTFSPVDPLVQSITCGQGNCPNPVFFNLKGGLGGIQTGYNWQISRKALLGLEADIEWSKIQGAGTANFLFDFSPSNFQADQSVRWFGTIRGRAGYLPVDNLLIFLTGGLAYGRIEESVSLNSGFTGGFAIGGGFSLNCITGPSCFFGNSSRISTGWTAGAGIEYALWSNVSLKAEYLYVNLGSGDTINVVTQSTLPASPRLPHLRLRPHTAEPILTSSASA
jgi:outer membrane immunogenic protein